MKPNKTTIPQEATRLRRILKRLGYTKENPYRPEEPVMLEQAIDFPGNLDFASARMTAFWPEEKTVGFSADNEPDRTLVNSYQDYGDGNYTDSWWNGLEAIDTLAERLEDTLVQKQKGTLLKRLAKMLPAEGIALVFTRRETVRFINADGSTEDFRILGVWNQNGQTLVKYLLSDGEDIIDSAGDLHPADIREITKTIKR